MESSYRHRNTKKKNYIYEYYLQIENYGLEINRSGGWIKSFINERHAAITLKLSNPRDREIIHLFGDNC